MERRYILMNLEDKKVKGKAPRPEEIDDVEIIYTYKVEGAFVGKINGRYRTTMEGKQNILNDLIDNDEFEVKQTVGEITKVGVEYIKNGKPFNYKRYILENYGVDYLELEPYEKALLSSENQKTLKDFYD